MNLWPLSVVIRDIAERLGVQDTAVAAGKERLVKEKLVILRLNNGHAPPEGAPPSRLHIDDRDLARIVQFANLQGERQKSAYLLSLCNLSVPEIPSRYTIAEAARVISAMIDLPYESTLDRLKMAALHDDSLPSYVEEGHLRPTRTQPFDVVRVDHYSEEFYVIDLNKWLAKQDPPIAFQFKSPPGKFALDTLIDGKEAPEPPASIMKQQELEILQAIEKLKYRAVRLPGTEIKQYVRDYVEGNTEISWGKRSFDKAWQRLLKASDIRYRDP